MIIPVPPIESYDAPEGTFEAVCIEAREIEKGTPKGKQKFLRIVWELKGCHAEGIRYLVGKNYEPSLSKQRTSI